jgi:hypothetical protein
MTTKAKRFLQCYSETWSVTAAAKRCAVSRASHYKRLERDPRYRAAFEDAEALIGATIHAEICRRALEGWDTPVFWQGKQCGSIRKYSDRLLVLLAKAHCPEFRDRVTVEHCGGQADVRLRVEFVDVERNEARRERVVKRAQKSFGTRPVCEPEVRQFYESQVKTEQDALRALTGGTDRGTISRKFPQLVEEQTNVGGKEGFE